MFVSASVKETTEQSDNARINQNNNRAAENPKENTFEDESGEKLENTFASPNSEPGEKPQTLSQQQQRNAVCPIPIQPCRHKEKEFADWELSFKLPAKITPNKTYSSAPFYAVMLKTYKSEDDDCDGGEYIEALEAERKQLQKSQPERKVFAAYACPNMDAVNYDFEGRWDKAKDVELIGNFIAVYAGQTAEEAKTLRQSLLDEYPKATVKKMTAQWERIEQ